MASQDIHNYEDITKYGSHRYLCAVADLSSNNEKYPMDRRDSILFADESRRRQSVAELTDNTTGE